jgi:AraC family transcriptional regulator
MAQDGHVRLDPFDGRGPELFLPRPPVITSFQVGWTSVQFAHFNQYGFDTPEVSSQAHIIVMANWRKNSEVTMNAEGVRRRDVFGQDAIERVEILPAYVPLQSRCTQQVEFSHCYFDPAFVSQIAYESMNPDKVEIRLLLQQPDPLLWYMGKALRDVLEHNPKNSQFYVDALATAFAAHLVIHYATEKHHLREHNGLSKIQLSQAIAYINAHLGDDISLTDIAAELGMSHYYFSRLFKQSMGITAHKYLLKQRVERAKQLLRSPGLSVLQIAAKHFRKHVGLTPGQFRREIG